MSVSLESVLLIFLLIDSDLNDPLYIFSLRTLSFLTKVLLKQKVFFFETHLNQNSLAPTIFHRFDAIESILSQ